MALREWLESNGLTQGEFADRLCIKQPSVARWLRTGVVPAKRVPRVAAITGLPYHRLNPEFPRKKAA